MTREIKVNTKTFGKEAVSSHTVHVKMSADGICAQRGVSMLEKICTAYTKVVSVKRNISQNFVALTEALADKTAREGLFGEDRDKNYCGTSVDYVGD